MPVSTSYPGVYVTEVGSGVHTITGVATSIAAFIGRAARGPVDAPATINSYSDFERSFGGLWLQSSLGYAVRDFYRNGGGRALVVRLFHSDNPDEPGQAPGTASQAARQAAMDTANAVAGATAALAASAAKSKADSFPAGKLKDVALAVAAKAEEAANISGATVPDVKAAALAAALSTTALDYAQLSVGSLMLVAKAPGAWGNSLQMRVRYIRTTDPDTSTETLTPNIFNLMVRDASTGTVETFLNVSIDPASTRRVDVVVASESAYVRASSLPASLPPESPEPLAEKGQFDPWADNYVPSVAADPTANPPVAGSPELPATNTAVAAEGRAGDGGDLVTNDFNGPGKRAAKRGLYALENSELFNLLCIPPYRPGAGGTPNDGDIEYQALVPDAVAYCQSRRAVFLVDPPSSWQSPAEAVAGMSGNAVGTASDYAALYFPRFHSPDPLRENRPGELVPSGAVAGVLARTDGSRGVWKAPAGLDAGLLGVQRLAVPMTDAENGTLNPLGVNCLRTFPAAGSVVWGARTLAGNDQLASEWKYLPVRRTALFIEESLFRGTQWVVFEPNDEPLWAQIRLNVGAFMHDLFRQGAFQGSTPKDAYFVKCDSETTTQNHINAGRVNIQVGFAPLKPAEFVIISLQQIAGAVQV